MTTHDAVQRTPPTSGTHSPGSDVLPLGLRLSGRRVVLVGGGSVSARRARVLADAGAVVEIVAPALCPALNVMVAAGAALWRTRRPFRPGDLDGAWLVHVATGDAVVDAQVSAEAEAARVFCIAAGDASAGTAWVPASARVGPSVVSVVSASESDRDPRRSRELRDSILDTVAQESAVRTTRTVARPETAPQPVRRGSVALVGGGPGALDLLTVRAWSLLAAADVVVIDRLAPRAVLDDLPDHVEVIDVGKSSGDHPVPQEEINRLLVERARAGLSVVRLKGGDPYVFGRGGEELDACVAAGVEVEVVPGVTSAVSVPAAAGIPVTHRGLSRGFSVLTGHDDVGTVPVAKEHTLVLLMGLGTLARTAAALVADGHDPSTPAAVVEDGYGPRQRTTVGTLATIGARAASAGVRPPAVTVVGEVVTRSPAWVQELARSTAQLELSL